MALNSARRIGMAVGIVMATCKTGPDTAFDMLVVASQRTDRKLRDIAEDVVQTGDLNWAPVCEHASSRPGTQVRALHLG